MIRRVLLENWRTHRRSEFLFGPGTNVLVGVMGSGKTSVMDAICYALFGTFPALSARRLPLEGVVMSRPAAMEQATVLLEFDYCSETYSVERTITRRGVNSAVLKKGGKLIAGPKTSDVTAAIERLLEVSYELFARAVYSEQNQIDYFLRLTAAQRKEKFDELLGINRYECARANATTLQNRLKKSAEERELWLKEQRGLFDQNALSAAEQQLKGLAARICDLEDALKKCQEGEKKLQEELLLLENGEREYRALHDKLLEASAFCGSLSRAIFSLERELSGATERTIAQRLKDAEAALESTRKSRSAVEAEQDALQQRLNEFSQRKRLNESKVLEAEARMRQLSSAGAECPVCKGSLSSLKKGELAQGYSKQIASLRDEIAKTAAEETAAKQRLSALLAEKRSLDRAVEEQQKHILAFESLALRAKRISDDRKLLAEKEAELLKLDSALKKLDFDEATLRKKRSAHAEAHSAAGSLSSEIRALRELQSQLNSNMEQLLRHSKQLDTLGLHVSSLKSTASALGYFINALAATQAQLRETLICTINAAMEDIWPRLYPYSDYVGVSMEISDGSYELAVRTSSGQWQKAEGLLSGGERSAAAITLRIAVSLVLAQNLSWLILDEPTHNLDSASIRELSSVMRCHLPQLVDQIFVITHDKQMEHAASSAVFVLERDKASGAPTEVLVEASKD